MAAVPSLGEFAGRFEVAKYDPHRVSRIFGFRDMHEAV